MSLERIIRIQEERRERKREIFKEVYSRVEQKINNYASMGSQACYYEIPNFLFGFPLLNVAEVMEYVLARLNKVGFIAFQIENTNYIYISWELSALERKAMQKRRRKKRSKVSIEEEKEKRDDDLIKTLVSSKLRNDLPR